MKFLTMFGLATAFLFGFERAEPRDLVRPTTAVSLSTNVFKSVADSNIIPIKGPNNICIIDTTDDAYAFETHVLSCIDEQPSWLRVRMHGERIP